MCCVWLVGWVVLIWVFMVDILCFGYCSGFVFVDVFTWVWGFVWLVLLIKFVVLVEVVVCLWCLIELRLL